MVQWDAGLLPLRTGSIDRVISDMPFGNRCGNGLALLHFIVILWRATLHVVRKLTNFVCCSIYPGNFKVRDWLCPRVVKHVRDLESLYLPILSASV